MGDGVFPFKVIEYVASGRLVISTPLPDANLAAALKSVVFVKHDKASIVSVLHAARQIYELRRAQIETAVADVRQRFGEQALMQTVGDVLAASRNAETYEIEADALGLPDSQLLG
jgi:hypothetical protein